MYDNFILSRRDSWKDGRVFQVVVFVSENMDNSLADIAIFVSSPYPSRNSVAEQFFLCYKYLITSCIEGIVEELRIQINNPKLFQRQLVEELVKLKFVYTNHKLYNI